jgi:Alpha/beta hydrolase family
MGTPVKTIRSWGLWCAASVLLAACGGGDDNPADRGAILSAQVLGKVTIAQIDAATASSGLQPLSGTAKCDVDLRYVLYMTRDPAGAQATASTGVLVPSGTDPACTGPRPVVLYAHGTTTTKTKNVANVSSDGEGQLLMAMFAAQGFVVVAPNYLGYDRSSLGYHPYLNAEAQAVDMIDGLRAAKTHLAAESATKASAQLLITGYSQGGHVAMATHKVIERDHSSEFTVTAAGPMSGPYNLVKTFDVVVGPGPIAAGSTLFLPLLVTSFQLSYGNIYARLSDVYQAPFDSAGDRLLPTDTPIDQLIAQGKLPNDPTFTMLFGPGGLLTDSFRAAYPTSNFRTAGQTNTLLGWTPKRPSTVALCGGAQDPTVFYFNTTDMQADWATRNFLAPAWDLENRATLPAGATGDQIYGAFQARKTAAGANATAQYHGTLVPPFCTALVRGLFQQVLAAGI